MQKRFCTLLVVLMTVIFIIPSCGKYEEGPAFSILPKKTRVVNIWKVDKVFVNDVDRTSLYQDFNSSYKLELTKDEKLIATYTTTLGSVTENGTWALENSSENLVFTVAGDKSTFKILRLKSSEMWLEETVAGNKIVNQYISY